MRMTPSAIVPLLALPILLSSKAIAAENVSVSDGGSAVVTLSARELTRISMADSGDRLDKLLGVDGTIEVKPDASSGDVYVRPVDPTPGRAFSFFVRDTRGATYTLVATVSDIPAQTLLLHAQGVPLHPITNPTGTAAPYVRQVKSLVRAMATHDAGSGYSREASSDILPLWQQTQIVIDERWSNGDGLRGEVWSLRNTSTSDLHLDEAQFQNVYADVRAVAIGQQSLHAGQATPVYLVRGAAQ